MGYCELWFIYLFSLLKKLKCFVPVLSFLFRMKLQYLKNCMNVCMFRKNSFIKGTNIYLESWFKKFLINVFCNFPNVAFWLSTTFRRHLFTTVSYSYNTPCHVRFFNSESIFQVNWNFFVKKFSIWWTI